MYFDNNTAQNNSFVYVHYENQPLQIENVSSPSSTSSSSSVISHQNVYENNAISPAPRPAPMPITTQVSLPIIDGQEEEHPRKKKRQHVGYACDKCRERRVGCDRGKPICGQCKDRYKCQYSNHALRLDNVSMRQRLDELERQVSWLTSFVTDLEQNYKTNIPHVQQRTLSVVPQRPQQGPLSLIDWAVGSGWAVENQDKMISIYTTAKNLAELEKALKDSAMLQSASALSSPSTLMQRRSLTNVPHVSTKKNSFTMFESLNRYSTTNTFNHKARDVETNYLENDVKTRLIHQHHQCGFATLVSPSKFETHYSQGQLKPLVLSSVFSHAVPHCSIYHPHLIQIEDYRELGNQFYNHSHDALSIDEPANLSNIHQRTMLITFDLDLGRVRRAFIHIGIAIRMCFLLKLHSQEGHTHCKSPFEREQSKRIFWTVWFYDNMVTYLYRDQPASIKLDQITVDLPTQLAEFDKIEREQTTFTISLIQVRKLAARISEQSREINPIELVNQFKEELLNYYHQHLSQHAQFGKHNQVLSADASVWEKRNYFCILLDYVQCWITLYRPLLPSPNGTNDLTDIEKEAILKTSQAAVATVQLFHSWFQPYLQQEGDFDCFFRPYLYHFMSAKNIFSTNISHSNRSTSLITISRAYLVLQLHLYQTTPTKRSFDESQLEKDFMSIIENHQISSNEFVYQEAIDEALLDDCNADGGWSIFSNPAATRNREQQPPSQQQEQQPQSTGNRRGSIFLSAHQQEEITSRCSSTSIINDQRSRLDLDYF